MPPKKTKGGKKTTGKGKTKAQSKPPDQTATRSEWEALNLREEKWDLRQKQQGLVATLADRVNDIFNTTVKDKILKKGKKADPTSSDNDILEDFRSFLRAKVIRRFTDDDDELQYDEEWHPERFLGCGAFGNVALWVKTNSKAERVDYLAIKEATPQRLDLWDLNAADQTRLPVLQAKQLLASEAVVQSHLNSSNIENLVHLRGFKTINTAGTDTSLPEAPRWKLYTEYAPYGELKRLIDLYRAWNKYLPEVFLWHVFDGLSNALKAMADQEPDLDRIPQRKKLMPKPTERIVHFDIKPENIFLGKEAPRDEPQGTAYGGLPSLNHSNQVYPMVKLADFGISQFVGKTATNYNPELYFNGMGTQWYKAPEVISYGITWKEPPNGKPLVDLLQKGILQDAQGRMIDWVAKHEERGKSSGIVMGQPTNVFNIGKVMFDLATLSRASTYDTISTKDFEEYKKFGHNALPNFTEAPFKATNRREGAKTPYSEELMSLIQQCMCPKMEDRVKSADLVRETAKGLREQLERGVEESETEDLVQEAPRTQRTKSAKASSSAAQPTTAGSSEGHQPHEQQAGVPKVYFRNNEINRMKAGSEDFAVVNPEHVPESKGDAKKRAEYADIHELLRLDADPDDSAGPLTLPTYWNDHLKTYNKYANIHKVKRLSTMFQDEAKTDPEGQLADTAEVPKSSKSTAATKSTQTNVGRGKKRSHTEIPDAEVQRDDDVEEEPAPKKTKTTKKGPGKKHFKAAAQEKDQDAEKENNSANEDAPAPKKPKKESVAKVKKPAANNRPPKESKQPEAEAKVTAGAAPPRKSSRIRKAKA